MKQRTNLGVVLLLKTLPLKITVHNLRDSQQHHFSTWKELVDYLKALTEQPKLKLEAKLKDSRQA